jgi:L-rhamnose mutarotase
MRRRDFLKLTGSAAVAAGGILPEFWHLSTEAEASSVALDANVFYVSPTGNDRDLGTQTRPFATLSRVQQAVRQTTRHAPIQVWIREGSYYLKTPLTFGPEDSGTPEAPVVYSAYPGETVLLSGGCSLSCNWKPYRNGIMTSSVPVALDFTQLFVNGKRQIRARYPNYDPYQPGKSGYLQAVGSIPKDAQDPLAGSDADMTFSGQAPRGVQFDPNTFTNKQWSNPEDAEIHIFQQAYWGNLQWKLKEIDRKNHFIWFGEGGQQIGAKWDRNPAQVGSHSRFFIENVLEELDSPGEWFLDKRTSTLYYYPEQGMDINTALIEVPQLEYVIHFAGTQAAPVENITVKGVRLSHTLSTYMGRYEVPSLSDWAIHRGGTVFAEGTRRCSIEDCWFDAVGGNGVFLNKYNRSFSITGCTFTETGDSAICFVGDLEQTSGTQRAFPYECVASNNLVHDCGFYGKQIAGVYISRAKRITASHNLIYNMPRAAICIGDSTWGGHVIEFNETHDTVLETSDHGPFNAWGRDRAWSLAQSHGPYTADRSIDAWDVLVDAMEPVIVRNNLFNERSGWGLDLDDGASNYKIYNNISIGGVSFKWREGAHREVYNNIWYNSHVAPCFHVGNNYNHDRYYNNIVVMDATDTQWPDGWPWWPQMFYSVIAPPATGPWFEEIDRNCFYSDKGKFQAVVDQLRSESGKRNAQRYDLAAWQELGFDRNSVFADPLFVNSEKRDFRVRPESPALKLGFKNFDMGTWGLTKEFSGKWSRGSGFTSERIEPTMKRVGMVIGIHPDSIGAYEALHAASNAGVRDLLQKYHMHNFTIFMHQLNDGRYYLFGYYEYTGNDYEADMKELAAEPRNREWLATTDPMQIPLPGERTWAMMREVYRNP